METKDGETGQPNQHPKEHVAEDLECLGFDTSKTQKWTICETVKTPKGLHTQKKRRWKKMLIVTERLICHPEVGHRFTTVTYVLVVAYALTFYVALFLNLLSSIYFAILSDSLSSTNTYSTVYMASGLPFLLTL